jgi:uncharacterized protein (TIGR02453 family)
MSAPRFNQASIDFLNKAARQKKTDWLDKNREEYQEVLVEPMRALMEAVAKNLRAEAPGYRFPTRNFARIKRSWESEENMGPYRDWFHTSLSRDSESRYESLPNLYFHFADNDFHSAGGHYLPSADQTKHIRSWIAHDPSELEDLLEDKAFKKIFKEGLGTERMLKTKPRDYPVDHPKFDWLRLSAWYVWRNIPKKIVLSKNFADVLTEDWRQVLRLNRILDKYTSTWPTARTESNMIDLLPNVKQRPLGDWD